MVATAPNASWSLALVLIVAGSTLSPAQTHEEDAAERFGRAITSFIARKDAVGLESVFDKKGFADRIFSEIEADPNTLRFFRPSFERSLRLTMVTAPITSEHTVRFIGVRKNDDESWSSTTRITLPNGWFNYVIVTFEDKGDGDRIADIQFARTSRRLSDIVRARAREALDPAFAQRFRNESALRVQTEKLRIEGRAEEALEALRVYEETTPLNLRLRIERVLCHDVLGEREKAELAASAIDTPDLQAGLWIQRIEEALRIGEYSNLSAHVEALERWEPRDPYLEYIRGITYMLASDDERAERALRNAIDRGLLLSEAYNKLITTLLELEDFEATADLLTRAKRDLSTDLRSFEPIPDYADFVVSEAGKRWLAEHPDGLDSNLFGAAVQSRSNSITIEEFVEDLAKALIGRDLDRLDGFADVDRLLDRALRDVGLTKVQDRSYRQGVRNKFRLRIVIESIPKGTRRDFLRLDPIDDKSSRAIFRLSNASTLDYRVFRIESTNPGFAVTDIDYVRSCTSHSTFLRDFASLVTNEDEGAAAIQAFARAKQHLDAGQFEAALEAIEEYSSFSPEGSQTLFMRYQAFCGLLDTGRAQEAFDAICVFHAEDEQLPVFRLRWYILTAEYERALEVLDPIDRWAGGDPYIDFLRGQLHSELDQPEEAKRAHLRAITRDPRLPEPYQALVAIGRMEGNYEAMAEILHQADTSLTSDPARWLTDPSYEEFLSSEPGKRWLAERKREKPKPL